MKKKILNYSFLSIIILSFIFQCNIVSAKSTWHSGMPTNTVGNYTRKTTSMGQKTSEKLHISKNKFEYGLGDKRVFKHLKYTKLKNNIWIIRGKEVSQDSKPVMYQKIALKKNKLGIYHEPDTKVNKDRTLKGVKKAKAVNWYKISK